MVAATRRSRYAVIASLIATSIVIWLALRGGDGSSTSTVHDGSSTAGAKMTSGRGPLRGHAGTSTHDAAIAGVVRDEAGLPIAGAQVCTHPHDVTVQLHCTEAGQNGRYLLEGIRPGRIYVWANARAFRPTMVTPTPAFVPGRRTDGVDIVLYRGGAEIHGSITDSSGRGIPNARIEVGSVLAHADKAGHYSMWVASGWALLHISAEGYAGAYRGGPAPGELGAILVPGADVTGTVVDEAGEPVADAAVAAVHTDPNGATIWSDAASARSDADGHFALAGMTSGRFDVTARTSHGSGLASVRLGVGEAGDGLVIKLARGSEIVGHVQTSAGTPCVGPAMWVRDDRGHYLDTELDANQVVHAGGLAAGTYEVQAGCADRLDGRPERITIIDRDVERTWKLAGAGAIRGRVTTKRGTPVADADVMIEVVRSQSATIASVTTEHDGSYEMVGLSPGEYKLTARLSPSSSSPAQVERTVTVHGTETVTLDFTGDVANLGSIRGRVLTPRAHTWKRLLVVLEHVVPESTASDQPIIQPVSVNVDDAGNFAGDGIPADHYMLTVSADDGSWPIDGVSKAGLPVTITGGATTKVDVHARVGDGVIRGRVADPAGQPLSNVIVMAHAEQGDDDLHFESDLRALTDSDGHFEIRDLSGDKYAVRAVRRESVDSVKRNVVPGSTVDFTLPGTAAVSGFAHRATPALGLGDLEIVLLASNDHSAAYRQTFLRSDGHFTIDDIAPGTYTVVAIADGSQAKTEITVVDGAHPTIDLSLPELVTVTGRIIDVRTRKPISRMLVSINSAESQWMNRGTFADASHTTDDDGRFTIAGVPRMKITIHAEDLDASSATGWVEVIRDVSNGPDRVDLGDLVAVTASREAAGGCGCVVRANEGKATVYSVVKGGPGDQAGIVDEDIVTAVDGITTTAEHAALAELLLAGPVGTTVEVTLQRGDTVTLTRAP